MRRLSAVLAVLAVVCASASAADARTFTVLSPASASKPATGGPPASFEVPNAAGSLSIPFSLSRPPAQPVVLTYEQLVEIWQRAGGAYGVPWEVLAAINKVESNFGRNMGPSSAGAIGWMQFMPSTWVRWGTDANGDGIADPWNPEDAVFSAARYLAAAGAHNDLSRAIFAYNHAQWYVDEILNLAGEFDSGDGGFSWNSGASPAALRLDALQQQLAQARREVAKVRQKLPVFESSIERLERKKLVLSHQAGDPSIPVGKFKRLESRIAAIEETERSVSEKLDQRRADLDAAVTAMNGLRDQLASAAVDAPAAASVGGAQTLNGYVFPVGGGPAIVSVSHHHHDYPAADIAAPEGSPLYALADSIVVSSWSRPDKKCGIGLELQLTDGTEYLYCHLSYLEPSIVPGAALAAGAPVGLVGHTGHATGPHLHLQFVPATSYPQVEPWFRSFAGLAFSWQDAPTPERAEKPVGRVFTILADGGSDPVSGGVITFTR
jgi:murein DD-endopeptidase MepM/ murein hydrolase activator NlpD